MKIIGITGGAGAGKTAILSFIEEHYAAKTLSADKIAHEMMEPSGECYPAVRELFPQEDMYLENGSLDRAKIAQLIFDDREIRRRLNRIVHPAVRRYIEKQIVREEQRGEYELIVIEAALLVEERYSKICDEMWYVYASEQTRAKRLMEERGYSFRKVQQIFDSQITEEQFRAGCQTVIDNDAGLPDTFSQICEAIYSLTGIDVAGYEPLQASAESGDEYVFGLDIGTRNVVGTVGYKEDNEFIVVAQYSKQHETRAMLDGQIHDIAKVGKTIGEVKAALEAQIKTRLREVCIAAAGRVLKTVTTRIDFDFQEETVVTAEDIHNLELLGIEKAQDELMEHNDTNFKFYCVGYSVIKYYLNDDVLSSLESHKAERIGEEMVVTFLPEDVVDGLYTAVSHAGLQVANMTLEPIAAMNVAIPETFRMLNIALVDVGAGTSDISITKDGSIIAYGMIPLAGDELTEMIVQTYLVDFKTAERMKLDSGVKEEIEYKDIMSISHTITAKEIWDLTAPAVERITSDVADKIRELNGNKTVSAVFVIGGGGKIHGFTEHLAELLDLPQERVALRGEEVLQEVHFKQEDIVKDPLLVTPIGICYNYYEQKNNFIFVYFNGERLKLFDNNRLTIIDAAMQAGFPNEHLFQRRGRELNFYVNGRTKIVRGEPGESAVITVDGRQVTMNTPLEPNSNIEITPSTIGEPAHCTIEELSEFEDAAISFIVNGKHVTCQRFIEVNGSIEPSCYEVQEGDVVEIRNYYTVEQLAKYMDVELDPDKDIFVNNRPEDLGAMLYDNFSVDWTVQSNLSPSEEEAEQGVYDEADKDGDEGQTDQMPAEEAPKVEEPEVVINVIANGIPVTLSGKSNYIFVDIFDFIDFDLQDSRGRAIVTLLNDAPAQYGEFLKNNDKIDIYWREI